MTTSVSNVYIGLSCDFLQPTSNVCASQSFVFVFGRWDCSFQYGSLVEEVDGHTAILYHRLQLDWFPM